MNPGFDSAGRTDLAPNIEVSTTIATVRNVNFRILMSVPLKKAFTRQLIGSEVYPNLMDQAAGGSRERERERPPQRPEAGAMCVEFWSRLIDNVRLHNACHLCVIEGPPPTPRHNIANLRHNPDLLVEPVPGHGSYPSFHGTVYT